ncbi:hypothetical protein QRX50_39655 [Amycolatopsis carbonis]|uniref:Outer membrane channel protein CpnT-like N-terminal domain-containing protein n=1 Tax=Amycolatopsis carbonis TaxID=715471 RepID=A0A9Y2IDF1_9PSEU|nr:hypothetical protein [Amycolatopsis sp. 2-15]WIX77464.1 hypothetical protein QRX50_39655 [Amycolatopsis sp. 2-15]
MAIPEPNNELYAAVRQVANVWPPDDEDAVTELAQDWRKAGKLAGQAGTELAEQRQAAERAWRDQAGKAMGQSVAGHAITLQQQHAEQVAQLGDRYAQALKDVKTAIVTTIAIKLPEYLYWDNPKSAPPGRPGSRRWWSNSPGPCRRSSRPRRKTCRRHPRHPTPTRSRARRPTSFPWRAWAGIGSDATSLLPGGRAVGEVADETFEVTKSAVANSAVDTVLQVPTAIDLSSNDDRVDTLKDAAGDVGLAKGLYQEGPGIFRMLHR